jgi:hypothetical protein
MSKIIRRTKLSKTYTYQGDDNVSLEFTLNPSNLNELKSFRDLLSKAITDVEDDINVETVIQSTRK